MEKLWKKLAEKELKKRGEIEKSAFLKNSVPRQRLYTSKDLDARNYKESFPGTPPYTRGSKATMYTGRPWTIRQYSGFSTAKESNAFYRANLAQGQKGLSIAFDLPTHRGYDSDHQRVIGDVGKSGVAIDTVEDMKTLFDGISLDKTSVSMTMNGAVLPVLGCFIVAGEEQGVPLSLLSGTIQNDILKEYLVRNTYIYPPEASMRIVSDVIEFTSNHMPRFNSISISGYHLQEAGADATLELAYTLADGLEYVRKAIDRGLHVDDFAPRLSFFFGIGMNFFTEIAKLRAARTMWYHLMQEFSPKDPRSSILRTHCQTSGYSLAAKDPYNNIVRTTIEALSATLGGTQSLHTNSFDEALALPSDFSARIARNIQLILKEETDLCSAVDPFGGSYFMESLTLDMIKEAEKILQEVESEGGMTKAILSGIPKMRIEQAAAKTQAAIDKGDEVIVGVNQYVSKEDQGGIDLRRIDQERVFYEQKKKLESIKKTRNQEAVKSCLRKLKKASLSDTQNLLPTVIEAVRSRATVGEISQTIAEVFGRYEGGSLTVSQVYSKNIGSDSSFKKAVEETENLAKTFGRRPRILIAKLGQDGHDRGAKVIATGFSDIGFDVDLSPLFQTPEEVAAQAIENDVHIIGISSQAAAHETLVPEMIAGLKKQNADDIIVVVGGIIPENDIEKLKRQGVAAVFTPGTPVSTCALKVLKILRKKEGITL